MKIQKLPDEARSKLQSGIVVTDAVQCVMELVHNSLDAEATGIVVRINVKDYQIRVIDNGKGIKKDDLEFVGERFMTSKYHPFVDLDTSFPTYGFRGQALSSLRDVSRSLTIETKSEDDGPTFVKVFKNNEASPITEIFNKRGGTGTTITIEDFMYTMPVRRLRISEVFDLEEIKNQLQYLAIIHYNVCFTLRNENKGLILLQTPQASSILESLTNMFGKTLVKSLKTLNYREKNYEISGYISLKPQCQNNLQFLYLNKRIVTKGVIHKFINNMIKEYRGKKTSLSNPTAHEILKSFKNSYTVYIIHIKCPHSYYELYTNLRKTTVEFTNWKEVLKCVHKALKSTFKNDLNFVNLCNSQDNNDKDINNKENKESKRAFGTSFLVNAVRGATVKRKLKKDTRKRRKIKTNCPLDNFHVFSKNKEKQDMNLYNSLNIEPRDVSGISNEEKGDRVGPTLDRCTDDSLESPIPKKKLKRNLNCDKELKKIPHFNQSFVEFYEWLKKKFETDTNACNLYHDFLEFKNKPSHSEEVSNLRSPVFAGKLKKKRVQSFKKKKGERSRTKIYKDISALDEEMAIMTRRHLKILSGDHLKMERDMQFTSEMKDGFPKTSNLNSIFDENLNFEKLESLTMFKKPQGIPAMNKNQTQVEYDQTLQSLPSSEAQFTNIIKFRNLSESFFRQSSLIQNEISLEKTMVSNAAVNSWLSHYQASISKNGSWLEAYKKEPGRTKKIKNINFYDLPDSSLHFIQCLNKKNKASTARDVEIQVNLSEAVPIKKVSAIVQTLQVVSESPSFENSYPFSGIDVSTAKNVEVNVQKHQALENNLSQKIPNPGIWNKSSHVQIKAGSVSDMNEIIAKNPDSHLVNEKHSISSEFMCGHKSYLSTNQQNEKSSSKETQTLAAMWTDSLTKLGSQTELHTEVLSNLKLESTQLPKTFPVEEFKCDVPHPIETVFYLTERHDFVPKGLSPKFLNLETALTSFLSPREKSRIKLTVDRAQNDLLANIKWQDEFTGDNLKPMIPDGIFLEMRQKAGECALNLENPVLSASLSYCAIKIQNLLHSFAFTKELLTELEILGQLDKKFIVTLMKISAPKKMDLISLFDQHAVDERIKLEEIMKENVSSDGKFISSCLDSPIECLLTDFDLQIISDLKEKILDLGLNFEIVNKSTISINAIPTFLFNKHEKDLKIKKETRLLDLLKSLIGNIIAEVTETRGAVSKIPKIIHNAFCLEACHKAVKFNKALTIENMTEMINKLQNCELPFQCAHGRPSVIPIIDLKDFQAKEEINDNIDLEGLKRFYSQRKDDIKNSERVLLKNVELEQ